MNCGYRRSIARIFSSITLGALVASCAIEPPKNLVAIRAYQDVSLCGNAGIKFVRDDGKSNIEAGGSVDYTNYISTMWVTQAAAAVIEKDSSFGVKMMDRQGISIPKNPNCVTNQMGGKVDDNSSSNKKTGEMNSSSLNGKNESAKK